MGFPTLIPFTVQGSSSAAVVVQIPVPAKCTIIKMQGAPNVNAGNSMTLIANNGSNNVGTLTWPASGAAGNVGTYAKDSTYGEYVFAENAVIKLTLLQQTTAAIVAGWIVVDEFARVTQ